MKLNKKILLSFTSLITTAAPIAVVVSCGNKETTAEENQRSAILASGSDYLLQKYMTIVNKNEFSEAEYNKNKEAAWNFWASSKLRSKTDFWRNESKNLVNSGEFVWADFIDNKKWRNYATDVEAPITKVEETYGAYPSWALAQEIMKKKPTLSWDLELENLLMVQRYMTSFQESEYKKVYKKDEDEPKNLDRKDPNFFLTKYIHSNTPTFVWNQTVSGEKHVPKVNRTITTADQFNLLGRVSLTQTKLGKQGQLSTSISNTTVNIGDLYNYKGISSVGISKGETDYSEWALRDRLKDNQSESGWVNEEGNIEKEAHVIVETDSVKSIFAMQFLPWMDAKDENDKPITDKKNKGEIDDHKSFWRLDSKLKNDPDKMQKLIFALVESNNGLINEAKKFMLDIRKYNLRTDNKDLESILKGKDIIKK